jgi:hypothetical protein
MTCFDINDIVIIAYRKWTESIHMYCDGILGIITIYRILTGSVNMCCDGNLGIITIQVFFDCWALTHLQWM